MDTYLFPPDLLDNQHTVAISCCETVRQNHKGMPEGQHDSKTVTHKLNLSDIRTRVRDNLTSMVWIDVYIGEYAQSASKRQIL
jgi:hypothetical protein